MAVTETQVCNLALLRVGERQTISSLTGSSQAAQACNALFAPARDELLERNWWKFATRRAVLALVSGATRTGWTYVYALPTDCVAPRLLDDGKQRGARQDTKVPFDVELNDGGTAKVLLTDQEDAELVYTAKVTTPALWSPSFVQALSWRLAQDLILALPVKPQLARGFHDKAELAIAAAMARDRNGVVEDQPGDSVFIAVRE